MKDNDKEWLYSIERDLSSRNVHIGDIERISRVIYRRHKDKKRLDHVSGGPVKVYKLT